MLEASMLLHVMATSDHLPGGIITLHQQDFDSLLLEEALPADLLVVVFHVTLLRSGGWPAEQAIRVIVPQVVLPLKPISPTHSAIPKQPVISEGRPIHTGLLTVTPHQPDSKM
uniref:Uncharacterized protein n=1 Tax=Arundo donax TaxID=35708 RepID=A0A0A9D6J1_ARUDO